MGNERVAGSQMDRADAQLLVEDLDDLLDDCRYKCEEPHRSKTPAHRAQCYLDLICIRHRLECRVSRLDRPDISPAPLQIAQDIKEVEQLCSNLVWTQIQIGRVFSANNQSLDVIH